MNWVEKKHQHGCQISQLRVQRNIFFELFSTVYINLSQFRTWSENFQNWATFLSSLMKLYSSCPGTHFQYFWKKQYVFSNYCQTQGNFFGFFRISILKGCQNDIPGVRCNILTEIFVLKSLWHLLSVLDLERYFSGIKQKNSGTFITITFTERDCHMKKNWNIYHFFFNSVLWAKPFRKWSKKSQQDWQTCIVSVQSNGL